MSSGVPSWLQTNLWKLPYLIGCPKILRLNSVPRINTSENQQLYR
ncbi:hypothetical protein CPAR01_06330, partial [Colletotrichum paranaense]